MPLDQARRQATEIVNAARNGHDPVRERQLARAAAADVLPLGKLINLYLSEHAARHQRPGSLVETKRALGRHWAPLHGLPAADVDRRAVSGRLLDLARTSGPVGANRARAHLSAAFAWGMKAGLVDHNPTIGSIRNDETSRERTLSIPELRAIWQATDDGGAYSSIIRLLMLTGARKSEIGGLAWPELDRSAAMVVLSGARTKNKLPHELPLSRQALAIVCAFAELPNCPYIFGRRGQAPFGGWSQCKARLDGKIAEQQGAPGKAAPLEPWRIHDIRRSFSTLAAEHELAEPGVIEAVLNHVSGVRAGVAGTYNRALYREPKRRTLQRWADWLERAINIDT